MGFEMKPCPFCGAGGTHLYFLFDGHTREGAPTGHVNCKPCGGRGPREVPKVAVAMWNSAERKFRPIMDYWDKQANNGL